MRFPHERSIIHQKCEVCVEVARLERLTSSAMVRGARVTDSVISHQNEPAHEQVSGASRLVSLIQSPDQNIDRDLECSADTKERRHCDRPATFDLLPVAR